MGLSRAGRGTGLCTGAAGGDGGPSRMGSILYPGPVAALATRLA